MQRGETSFKKFLPIALPHFKNFAKKLLNFTVAIF